MTLLIRNVVLLGAGARSGEHADVFVSGDRISAIGSFPTKSADAVIDGRGMYLSPGFIDIDTTADHYLTLFTDPGLPEFLHQGVTSIIGGQCGASLAPLIYGELESIRKWADTSAINVDWHSMKEFLKVLDRRRLGVNFGTLVGATTIRRAIVGDEPRVLTRNELRVFGDMIQRGLKEGAFGFSLGLGYLHGRNTTISELRMFAEIVKKMNGVFTVHLREESQDELRETLDVLKLSGARTLVNHLLPILGQENEYRAMLADIGNLPAALDFHFGVRLEDARSAALYMLLPEWAQKGNRETMNAEIKDDWLVKKILRDMPEEDGDRIVVKEAPHNEFFVGKNLDELGEIFGKKSAKETLLELMRRTELAAVISRKDVDEALLHDALLSPHVLIGSHASGEEIPTSVAFPRFLGFVDENDIFNLHDAIEMITAIPAKKFGIAGRGVIEEGAYADLTGFSFDADSRNRRVADIRFVAVNGTVAVKDGAIVSLEHPDEGRAGRVLRRGS